MFYDLTGLSRCDSRSPIETYAQLGGPGRVLNKALAIPMHLGRPWQSIELVSIPVGSNGVGPHVQATDEIYLIVSGTGKLVTNGQATTVGPGTLAIAPQRTFHEIANVSLTEPLTFLVIEIQAPVRDDICAPQLVNLYDEFHEESVFPYHVQKAGQPVSLVLASTELQCILGGAWGPLSLLVLPPGSQIERYIEPEFDQLFFVIAGHATVMVSRNDAVEDDIPFFLDSEQGTFEAMLVPRGAPFCLLNRASGDCFPLLV